MASKQILTSGTERKIMEILLGFIGLPLFSTNQRAAAGNRVAIVKSPFMY